MTRYIITAALVRRGDTVLLVQQQSPDDPQPSWALPSGVVEPSELLHEALARELREETGLDLARVVRLAFITQTDHPDHHQTIAFTFEAEAGAGEPEHNDPDQLILDARFLPIAEAIARLRELPWPAMRDAAIAYLQNETKPGATWLYRRNALVDVI